MPGELDTAIIVGIVDDEIVFDAGLGVCGMPLLPVLVAVEKDRMCWKARGEVWRLKPVA
jgi:hypothetical protein